jgi:hypothetical protein
MKKKKKTTKETNAEKLKVPPQDNPETKKDNEDRLDFGGLPERDLKKNLGFG